MATTQDIANAASQDLLVEVGADHPAWVDYVNRVQLFILKFARWDFMVSAPQRIITELEQSDYWIGPAGRGPIAAVDSGLNICDFQFIKQGSVIDRSNNRFLKRVAESPFVSKYQFPDATQRHGTPRVYRYDASAPNVLSIYPAPNNQNSYRPLVEAPYCTTTSGGTLPARIYYVKLTLVDTLGNESSASDETKVYLGASDLLVVHPPNPGIRVGSSGIRYDRYNIYASTSTQGEVRQNTDPISIDQTWAEPTSGLGVLGAAWSTANNLTPMDGYVIQFRYYRQRQIVTSLTQTLQVPDDYKDVVVAGANWFGLSMLKHFDQASVWQTTFREGLMGMVRDKNQFPKAEEYISPDVASAYFQLPSVETVELANLLNI